MIRYGFLFLFFAAATLARAQEEDSVERRLQEMQERQDELERQIEKLTQSAAPPPNPLTYFNPAITVFGNTLWRMDDRTVREQGQVVDDTVNLREVELDFRAAIDPYADGVVIGTFESETPGQFEATVEEGYATIKRLPVSFLDDPPMGLKFKVGRFRTEFGRFNRLHLHDLPQANRPLAQETFLGEEGHLSSGLSAQMFLPSFEEESSLELTVQALQGGGLAFAPAGNEYPAYVSNLRWFRTFSDVHQADVSVVAFTGNVDNTGRHQAQAYSIDGLYKWKPLVAGEHRSFVAGGQLFWGSREFLSTKAETNTPFGYFIFGQYQFDRCFYGGVRFDWTEALGDDGEETRRVQPYLSFYPSEFLRFRLGYERSWSDEEDEDYLDTLLVEVNIVFGSHPVEPFWVNK